MLNMFKSEEDLGQVYVAIAGHQEWEEWQVKVAETYEDTIEFTKHALFIFEDLTFIVNREAFAVDEYTGLKREMRNILEDIRLCLPLLYHCELRPTASPFPISQSKTHTIVGGLDFVHETKLARKGDTLYYQRGKNTRIPGGLVGGRYQAAAVYAVFDHLIMKVAKALQLRDINHFRVLYGIDVTLDLCERAGMFGSIGMLKEEGFGKLPRTAVHAMVSAKDDELKELYEEQINSPISSLAREMSNEEFIGFVQSLQASR